MEEKSKIMDKLKGGGVVVSKDHVQYTVSDINKTQVKAIVYKNGKITVKPSNSENFIFKNTTRDMVAKVAKLILEASKIEETL